MANKPIKVNQRPGKRGTVLTLTTTAAVKQQLVTLAQKWERSLSWTAEKILRDYLKSHR